jgi:hypothetical protein
LFDRFTMDNTIKKAESIRKAVEAYETNSTLGMSGTAIIYKYSHQSINKRLTKKNQPAPNTFISQQKIWPVEESVLVEHYIRNFKTDFPMTIQYFNACANELLKARNSDKTVNYYWHNSFFKRHPAIKSKFSRSINRRRINTENPDEFINFSRRFINTKNE